MTYLTFGYYSKNKNVSIFKLIIYIYLFIYVFVKLVFFNSIVKIMKIEII